MTPTVIALLCALALSAGIGGTLGVQAGLRGRSDASAELVEATAEVAAAASKGASDAVTAAMTPAATEAEARLAFATMPAANLATEAALKGDATPAAVALAGYAICVQGAQAQQQGAAAFGCPDMAKALTAAVDAVLDRKALDASIRSYCGALEAQAERDCLAGFGVR